MDERQSQIREGAGLEESRINTDFVEFLKKWGPRFLTLVIVVSAVWLFFRFRAEQRDTRIQQGFAELQNLQVGGVASPESLLQVAAQYEGVRGVPHIARLAAADAYLDAVRRGLEPGSLVQVGGVVNDEDILDEQGRANYLDRAAEQYQRVYENTKDDADARLHTLGALFGLASVAESRADADDARRWYEIARETANGSGFPEFAAAVDTRLADLDEAIEMVSFLSDEDLPPIPGELPPMEPTETPTSESPASESSANDAIEQEPPADPTTDPTNDPANEPSTSPAAEPGTTPKAPPAATPSEPPAGG